MASVLSVKGGALSMECTLGSGAFPFERFAMDCAGRAVCLWWLPAPASAVHPRQAHFVAAMRVSRHPGQAAGRARQALARCDER
jgi:hypothetical protein